MTWAAPPPSLRGCVVGRTGSGKTWWMHHRWLSQSPRVLIVDQTGEWRRLEPDARFAVGYADTILALHEVAARPAWRVVTNLTNEELYRLVDVLIPVPDIARSPCVALGGVTLYLDEVDLVIPTHAPPSARSINRRSRHAGLSVLCATQRISNVSKEITSMSDFIGILAIHEPACLDYLESLMGRDLLREALEWADRPYHVAVFRPPLRQLILVPPGAP